MSAGQLIRRLALVLMLVSLGLLALRVSERGRFAAPFSSYGAGPEGALALFQLTRELGFNPQRKSQELIRLPQGTLFAFADCHGRLARPLMRPEREELARWVAAGGLLIVAGAEHYAPEESGVAFDSDTGACATPLRGAKPTPPRRNIQVIPSGPPLAHSLPFTTHRARAVRATFESEATTLLDSELGPLGMTVPLGRGRVVVLGTLDLLTNQGLPQGGGVLASRLLEAFAPAGPVWFDEYHLGMGERRSLIHYFREQNLAPSLIQVCLAALAFLLSRAQRLGKIRNAETGVPSGRKFRDAMATLYAKSADKAGTLEVLTQHAIQRIARAFSLSPQASPEDVMDFLRDTGRPRAAAAIAGILLCEGPLERGESMLARTQTIHAALRVALADADVPQQQSALSAPRSL